MKSTTVTLGKKTCPNKLLNAAMNFDLSKVSARVLRDNPDLKDQIREIELEYRKFMYLCATKPRNLAISVPSQKIDEFWHCHIIHTKLYMNFCQVLGVEYIHHSPHDENTTAEQKQLAWNNLIHFYRETFGSFLQIAEKNNVKDCVQCDAPCAFKSTAVCSRTNGFNSCGPNCTVDCSDECSTCRNDCASGGDCRA
jgi:hypothetical protein